MDPLSSLLPFCAFLSLLLQPLPPPRPFLRRCAATAADLFVRQLARSSGQRKHSSEQKEEKLLIFYAHYFAAAQSVELLAARDANGCARVRLDERSSHSRSLMNYKHLYAVTLISVKLMLHLSTVE